MFWVQCGREVRGRKASEKALGRVQKEGLKPALEKGLVLWES